MSSKLSGHSRLKPSSFCQNICIVYGHCRRMIRIIQLVAADKIAIFTEPSGGREIIFATAIKTGEGHLAKAFFSNIRSETKQISTRILITFITIQTNMVGDHKLSIGPIQVFTALLKQGFILLTNPVGLWLCARQALHSLTVPSQSPAPTPMARQPPPRIRLGFRAILGRLRCWLW